MWSIFAYAYLLSLYFLLWGVCLGPCLIFKSVLACLLKLVSHPLWPCMWTRITKCQEAFVECIPIWRNSWLSPNCSSGQLSQVPFSWDELPLRWAHADLFTQRREIKLFLPLPYPSPCPHPQAILTSVAQVMMLKRKSYCTPLPKPHSGLSLATPASSCSSNRSGTLPLQVFCACSFLFLKGSFPQRCTWLPSPFIQTQLKCYLPSQLRLRQRLPTLFHLNLCLAWSFSITFTIIWHPLYFAFFFFFTCFKQLHDELHQGRGLCGCRSLLFSQHQE